MFTKISYKKKKEKHLHIVSFDVPYPPNYGGVIDVYYKIQALHQAGIKVHLHAYEYGRGNAEALKPFCESIQLYKRNVAKTNLFKKIPYIIATRASEKLVSNLTIHNYPILFEGLHTTFFLNDKRLKKHRKIVRTHNIEHLYYLNLAKIERSIFKRYYFFNEASKLRRFEPILTHADGIAVISHNDYKYFSNRYKNVQVISAFHPNNNVNIAEGSGDYALYHGNLSVGENNSAAIYLIENVFNTIEIPLIIAGNKPSKELRNIASQHSNIILKSNLSNDDIFQLIHNAHVNILPTFQATGIKLKLLAALFNGRHCLVNTPMIKNTGLEDLVVIKDQADMMRNELVRMFNKPFSETDVFKREDALSYGSFSNQYNVNNLIKLLFY